MQQRAEYYELLTCLLYIIATYGLTTYEQRNNVVNIFGLLISKESLLFDNNASSKDSKTGSISTPFSVISHS